MLRRDTGIAAELCVSRTRNWLGLYDDVITRAISSIDTFCLHSEQLQLQQQTISFTVFDDRPFHIL